MKETTMSRTIYFAAIMVTCLALATSCSADSHAAANQGEKGANPHREEIITIQVSSFKKPDGANRAKSRLISRGLDAFVDYEQVKDKGMWYRVYIGQFETRKAAIAFAEDLVQQGVIAGYWVKKKKVAAKGTTPEKRPQKESVKADAKIEAPADETTVSPPEESAPPPLPPIAADTQPTPAERKAIENAEPKEAPAALQADTDMSKQDQNRLSLGIKASFLASHRTGEFEVSKSENGSTETWTFDGAYFFFGIVGNYRLNDAFTIESSIEKGILQNIDNWLLSVAVKYQWQPTHWFTPYLRGGGIVGRLHWDDMPGDFDTGLGLEGGLGMHLFKSNFRVGLEASYRYMQYAYNPSAANDTTYSKDHLDMSGLVLSGTLSYVF
jgi:opacity protein-like surface antigen